MDLETNRKIVLNIILNTKDQTDDLHLDSPKSARHLIISLLSLNWPLTTKQIYNVLKKSQGYTGTYQAVHKAIKALIIDKVISNGDGTYSLNKEWVLNNKTRFEKLYGAYCSDQKIETVYVG